MPPGLSKMAEMKWKRQHGLNKTAGGEAAPPPLPPGHGGAASTAAKPAAAQEVKKLASGDGGGGGGLTMADCPPDLKPLEILKWKRENGIKG